jgi:glycosyltransferase involved in cell wall biosynthesis
VHIHGSAGQWVKALRATPRGTRTIATLHGVEGDEPMHVLALMRWAAHRTDRVVAVSDDLSGFLEARLGVPAGHVEVVRNGIPIAGFQPRPATGALRIPLGIPVDTKLIALVGRLDAVKQPLALLEAFARVRCQAPDARLVFVGDGVLRKDVLRRAAERGLSSAVSVTGFLSQLETIYPDIDVLTLPSRFEGTSLALLEAMASGVPVVASRVGGNADVLGGGDCGTLVPCGDIAALAEAILECLSGGPALEARRQRALERVRDRYSEDAMVSRYEALYR